MSEGWPGVQMTLYRYVHDCENLTLQLFEKEFTGDFPDDTPRPPSAWRTTEFRDVAACHIERAVSYNLDLSIKELPMEQFLEEFADEIARNCEHTLWPEGVGTGSVADLAAALPSQGYRAFILCTAWGLHGWVLARTLTESDEAPPGNSRP